MKYKRLERGFVYVVKCAGQDIAKIGCTKNVKTRMNTIKTYCPYPIHLYRSYEVNSPARLEEIMHDLFSEKRMNGEWFNLVNKDEDPENCDLLKLIAIVQWYDLYGIGELTRREWVEINYRWRELFAFHYNVVIRSYKEYINAA